jgi:DNA-binding winged helix-turn-helix (wHTH) protein
MASQTSHPPGRWRFGPFELDAGTRELRKNGLRVRLQEQPARILEALLLRPGELVTREELREHLWPADTFVDFERSLNAAVAKLRQVLSDSAEQPRYVETIARRGYRFVAPVGAETVSPSPASGAEASTAPPDGRKWVWLAAALAVLIFATFSISRITPRASPGGPPAVKFVIPHPEGTRIHPMSAISADGSKLAFVAVVRSGERSLWLRALASEGAIRLENTDDAVMPFFSPDAQNIAFFADRKLKRIPASGGVSQTLCDADQPAGGTWSRDNLILFSQGGRLYRVPAGGGAATALDRPGSSGRRIGDRYLAAIPTGWAALSGLNRNS